jgi:hypothetical protein
MLANAFFVLMSGVGWFLVFSKSARQKMPTPWWVKTISKEHAEQRYVTEVLLLVLGLMMGIVFTLISIVRLLINFSRG